MDAAVNVSVVAVSSLPNVSSPSSLRVFFDNSPTAANTPSGDFASDETSKTVSPVAGSVSYDDPTRTATFIPDATLDVDTTYTVEVSGATDAAGNPMAPDLWSFTTVGASACPCTIWPDTTVPPIPAANDQAIAA